VIIAPLNPFLATYESRGIQISKEASSGTRGIGDTMKSYATIISKAYTLRPTSPKPGP